MNARTEESVAVEATSIRKSVHQVVAFVEMLSLGFATIGVSATLRAIGSQLTRDVLKPLHLRRCRAAA